MEVKEPVQQTPKVFSLEIEWTGREGEREGGGEEKEERGWEPLEAEKRLCGVPDLKHRTKRREGGI